MLWKNLHAGKLLSFPYLPFLFISELKHTASKKSRSCTQKHTLTQINGKTGNNWTSSCNVIYFILCNILPQFFHIIHRIYMNVRQDSPAQEQSFGYMWAILLQFNFSTHLISTITLLFSLLYFRCMMSTICMTRLPLSRYVCVSERGAEEGGPSGWQWYYTVCALYCQKKRYIAGLLCNAMDRKQQQKQQLQTRNKEDLYQHPIYHLNMVYLHESRRSYGWQQNILTSVYETCADSGNPTHAHTHEQTNQPTDFTPLLVYIYFLSGSDVQNTYTLHIP